MSNDFPALNQHRRLRLQPPRRSQHLDLQQTAIRLGHLQPHELPLTPVWLDPTVSIFFGDFRIVGEHSLPNANVLNRSRVEADFGSPRLWLNPRRLNIGHDRLPGIIGQPVRKTIPETDTRDRQKQQTQRPTYPPGICVG